MEPQQVGLILTLAPEGWEPHAYKADRIVSYRPESGDDGEALSVSVIDAPSGDFSADYGASEVTSVRVQGHPATVGRIAEGWALEARTRDGQVFSVSAPASFTSEQVVEVAQGVRYRD